MGGRHHHLRHGRWSVTNPGRRRYTLYADRPEMTATGVTHAWPAFVPGGNAVMYTIQNRRTGSSCDPLITDAEGGPHTIARWVWTRLAAAGGAPAGTRPPRAAAVVRCTAVPLRRSSSRSHPAQSQAEPALSLRRTSARSELRARVSSACSEISGSAFITVNASDGVSDADSGAWCGLAPT